MSILSVIFFALLSDLDITYNWRVDNRCGVNCVFVWLRNEVEDVSYEKVLSEMPLTEEGATMYDLKNCLSKFGLSSTVVAGDPTWLQTTSLPIIAHVEWDSFAMENQGRRLGTSFSYSISMMNKSRT